MDCHTRRSHESWSTRAAFVLTALMLSAPAGRATGDDVQHVRTTDARSNALIAVEIADVSAVVDRTSIRALYGTIGFRLDDTWRRFESDAAKEAGNRVRRELSSRAIETPGPTTLYALH